MFTTHDLGLAAYLMIRSHKLCAAYINERKIYVFEFDDQDGQIRQTAVDYLNSDCSLFDAQVRNLKNILKSSNS